MKLWLDDIRDPKHAEGWEDAIWVKTPEEALEYLETGRVVALSFDNDLGLPDTEEGQPRDGYSVALWIERMVHEDSTFMPPDLMRAHTSNPAARPRLLATFKAIRMAVEYRDL